MNDKERFMDKVSIEPNSGCWLWTGCVTEKGYGLFRFKSKSQRAHRVSLILHGSPSPFGKVYACHKCDNPTCVNPDHLYWGTPKQNQADRLSRTGHHYRDRTHCKRGHKLTPENFYGYGRGNRQCRECVRVTSRRRAEKKNSERLAQNSAPPALSAVNE